MFGPEQSRQFGISKPERSFQTVAGTTLTAGEVHRIRELLEALQIVRETAMNAEHDYTANGISKQNRHARVEKYPSPKLKIDNDVEIRRNALDSYRRACTGLQAELRTLEDLFKLVGDSETIINASGQLRKALTSNVEKMDRTVSLVNNHGHMEGNIHWPLDPLIMKTDAFHRSLYHKKHTFRFREVKKWEESMKAAYDSNALWMSLEQAKTVVLQSLDSTSITLVTEELKLFSERVLPTFVANEEEKATTRYINMTTIATFFSSVTAQTLQFSFQQTKSGLGGAVNLFWFISLVFSVASGVNSLLGMTWRKSSIFDKIRPPRAIGIWLDKAPMVFLIIAAFSFVIGLNLFSFLSFQPRYVSLATIVFTGIHLLGISVVISWFLLELRGKQRLSRLIKTIVLQIQSLIMKLKFVAAKMRPQRAIVGNSMIAGHIFHLLRNIYWSFGLDDKVARLNLAHFLIEELPSSPYKVAKLLRHIGRLMKRASLRFKKSVKQFNRLVLRHNGSLPAGTHEDLEAAKRQEKKSTDSERASEETTHETKAQYRQSLEKVFQYKPLVDGIMWDIDKWEIAGNEYIDDKMLKERLGRMLWGYPELLQEFYEDIYPILAPIRLLNAEKAKAPETSLNNKTEGDEDHIHLLRENQGQVQTASEVLQREVRLIEYYPLPQDIVQSSGSDGSPTPFPAVLPEEVAADSRAGRASADVKGEMYTRDESLYPEAPQTSGSRSDTPSLSSPSGHYPRRYEEEEPYRWQEIFYPRTGQTAGDEPEDAHMQELRHAQSVEALYFGDEVVQSRDSSRAGSPFARSESDYALFEDVDHYQGSDAGSRRRNDSAEEYLVPSNRDWDRPLSTILDHDEDVQYQASSLSYEEGNIGPTESVVLDTEYMASEERFANYLLRVERGEGAPTIHGRDSVYS